MIEARERLPHSSQDTSNTPPYAQDHSPPQTVGYSQEKVGNPFPCGQPSLAFRFAETEMIAKVISNPTGPQLRL
jgi:hypothetical protein